MIFRQGGVGYGWIDFFYLLRSRWPVVFLFASLVMVAGAAWKRHAPGLFEGELTIALGDDAMGDPSSAAAGFRPSGSHDLYREAAELGSRAMLSEVAGPSGIVKRWKVGEADDLLRLLESRVSIGVLPEERHLVVRARDLTAEHAASLANSIGDRYLARKETEARAEAGARVRRLSEEIEGRHREISRIEEELVELADTGAAQEELAPLRRRLATAQNLVHSLGAKHQLALLEAEEAEGEARIISYARPERTRATTPWWLSLPGLGISGVLAGMMAMVALEAFCRRTRWDAVSDLMNRLDLQFAGFAPVQGGSPVTGVPVTAAVLEPYRDIRNRLLRLPLGECLFVTLMPLRKQDASPEAISNLACVLADAGRTVLVVDADFRNPSLHPLFDAAHHPGLSDFLSGEMRLEETVIRSRRANLWFMPPGPLHDDPGGLLNGKRMDDLVRDLKTRFDFILVASPSIHEVSDAGILASMADCNAVITPYLGHSVRKLRETRTALETVHAPLSGVLLTTRAETAAPIREASPERSVKAPAAGMRG
ncbi:MAG: hypothetical protein KDN18_12230 [Verrucomicrobiae bacterium]|nr:hypothetical protein [Verrucomicrobiae bacterium]